MDKHKWPPGPWMDEPDELEWRDEATGLSCLIRRGHFGQLNGYVGVPPGHPYYGWHGTDEIPMPPGFLKRTPDINKIGIFQLVSFAFSGGRKHNVVPLSLMLEVHGGLTFSGERTNTGLWYFGFDAGHSGDFLPGMLAIEQEILPTDLFKAVLGEKNNYRDITYMKAEVALLAKQLHAAQPIRVKVQLNNKENGE